MNYQLTINTSNPRLTWTLPNLSVASKLQGQGTVNPPPNFQNFYTIWISPLLQFSPSNYSINLPTNNSSIIIYDPSHLNFWGVNGAASNYTSEQLSTLNPIPIPLNFNGIIGCNLGNILGTGYTANFVFHPAGNSAGTLTSFKLERSPDLINWNVLSNTISSTDTSYDDQSIPNPTFYYRLTGFTSIGGIIPYNVVSITQPYTLSGTHTSNGSNVLSWFRT